MKRFLLVLAAVSIHLFVASQCVTNVNFNTWQQGGQPGNGNWSVQGGGTQVYQSVNGNPSFFLSPFSLMNVHVSGQFRSTDNDDDYLGFVFSFLNPLGATDSFDCFLYDWKQGQQGGAPSGMSLDRVKGVIPSGQYQTVFWDHTNTPEFTVLQNTFGGPGWIQGNNHNFDLYLTYTRATIYVDGVQKFDWQDCYLPGRFGFYNLSQRDCYYSNFQYDLFADFAYPDQGVCLGQSAAFDFVNACVTSNIGQYQSLTWNFGDGNSIVNNSPTLANVNVTHTYATAGLFTATMTIVDFNGCSYTSSHQVDVRNPIVLNPTTVPPLCNGASNGSISLAPTGGFGNFTYSWNGGVNTQQNWPGRPAGTYTVTVTDGICATSGQFTLNQPTAVTAVVSHTDAHCGVNDGTATITISGGTGPYYGTPIPTAVNWGPGHSGTSVTGLSAGTFIADFQDANGCSALLQYSQTILSLPCGISSTIASTNVNCFGGNNGTATLTVTGGTAPVNITWSNGMSGAAITGLVAGTYTYNYTDANPLHAFNGTVTIQQPTASIAISLAQVGISCPGSNDGQAIASVLSGGVTPYVYTWSGGHPNNPVASSLAPGNISVTVSDANSCSASATINVSGVPSLTNTMVTIIDSCYHSGKGRATVQTTGGNPPYTYAWNNFATDTSALNLIAGTYNVTVTDSRGCTATSSAVINGPATPLTSTYVKTDINCFGGATGTFNVTPAGGSPGYTFVWSPASLSGTNQSGLVAGIYNYTVTDIYGCRIVDGDTLREPAAALTAVTSHTNVTCNGANNGSVTITVAGGTPAYTYLGNPIPAGTNTLSNLPPNTYAGNVIDSKGCTVAVTETITQPPVLTLSETHVNVLCNGALTGSINLTPGGGTPNYSYLWNDGNILQNRTNLAAGTYTVTLTDNNLCTASASITITQPALLTVTETHVNVLCNGANTGSINLTPGGGTPNYTYLWNDASALQNRINLAAATYNVTVTDNALCTITTSIIITQPTSLSVTTSHTDVTCNGSNNGTVTVTIGGGTPPYSYLGNPIPAGTTTIPNLAPATYAGNVLDANGCSVAVSETIIQPGPQSATVTGTNNLCFGATQGTAQAVFVNATGLVSYNWTGGLNTANITNLVAGVYDVTCTDANLCTVTGTYTVTEPAAVVMTLATVNAVCFGGNGSATATPNGGTAPFSYVWSGSPSTINTATLVSGNFTVTSTDANTCQQTASGIINSPTAISVTETHVDVDCFGNSSGSVTLTTTGGTGPNYTYVWSPNVSVTNSAAAMAAANYSITVTDQVACTATIAVAVAQPAAPLAAVAVAQNISCFGLVDGSVTVTATGGTVNYSYTWNPNVSATNVANALAANNYSITVTDANACTVSASATVTEPTQIVLTTSQTDLLCYQVNTGVATVNANGGTPNYTYTWNPNVGSANTASALAAGNYNVTVTDNSSCTASVSVTLTEPTQLVSNPAHTDNSCFGNTNAVIAVNTSGGTPAYTYLWNPNVSSTDSALNLVAGNYSFTVTDNNACTITQTVTVLSPAVLDVTAIATNAHCFGDLNGTITTAATGGTNPYNFSITNDGINFVNLASGQFTGLAASVYTVYVTDANACVDSTISMVNEPAQITDIILAKDVTCYHYTNGELNIIAGGGVGGYTFALSDGSQNSSGLFTALVAGNYDITIADANNCTTTDSTTITEPDSVQITVTPDPVEVNLGESLQLQTSNNQTGTITYNWQPAFGLSCYDCAAPVFNGNYSQIYTVVMSTDSGCYGTSTVNVTVVPKYDVFIPNVFTPNGDGVNDEWQIFGNMKGIKQLNVAVFNRWGEKVFESNDINFGWNGKYQAELAPPGVYTYTAKFVWLNNHSDNNYMGTITLIR